jgi:hypothetical protein
VPPENVCQRRTETSTYLGSSSINLVRRECFSQAIIVEPEPPNRSRTISPVWLLFVIGYSIRATGFIVGRSSLLIGRSKFHTVVWVLSVYQLCAAVGFQPYRTGSLPVVILPPEDHRLFDPHAALRQFEPGVYECFAQIDALGIGVEHINRGTVVPNGKHICVSIQEEAVKRITSHRVVLNGQCFFGLADLTDIVGRGANGQVRFGSVQEFFDVLLGRSITTHDAMIRATQPYIAGPGNRPFFRLRRVVLAVACFYRRTRRFFAFVSQGIG